MARAPKELETLWGDRLEEAESRLDFVRNSLKRRDGWEADGQYQRAIDLERLAFQEYHHVLKVFSDLVVDGKEPDEAAWQQRMAPGAGLM